LPRSIASGPIARWNGGGTGRRAADMIETLDEIRDGLRQLAIDSLTLSDELRRFLHDMLTRPTATRQTLPHAEEQP